MSKTVGCLGSIPGHHLCCDLKKSFHLSVPQYYQENGETTSRVTVTIIELIS